MPGILGIITNNPRQPEVEEGLRTMLDCMRHEPFYSCGTYSVPEMRCYFGWVNHKESFADCNPVVSESGNTTLIFTGEHFSRPNRRGANGSVQSPAELLAAYEKKGDAFLLDLNGWFAGVLIDRRDGRVVVFNDRYGVGRVYWTQTDESFVFSSEAKSLLAVCPERRKFDPQALGQFAIFGSVLQNRTLFSDVSLLPGAAAWCFRNSPRPRRDSYFSSVTWENQASLTPDEYYEALKSTIRGLVPEYCSSNTGLGISLTGGLDTRIIMAALPDDERLSCYTYGGVYRDCYDVRAAAEVASVRGLHYELIPLKADFFANFSQLAERTVWLTDGTLDICGSHELYLSTRARQIAPIRMTGNYGSEVLRGVSTLKATAPSENVFTDDLRPYIDEALELHVALKKKHPISFAVMNEIPWHLYGRLAAAQSQLQLRSPYMDNELVRLAYQAPSELPTSSALSLRLISELHPRLSAVQTDMGLVGTGDGIQWYPRRLLRYLLFKAEWYYGFGMPQRLAAYDRMLRPLEPFFLGSHKIEHYRVWFRDQLADYVREMLANCEFTARPYVKEKWARARIDVNGISGHDALDISKLVTLQLIEKQFFSATSRSQVI